MSNNLPERRATGSEIVFYRTEDGRGRIEVRLEDDTVWLTQRLMAELFQTTPQNITMHVRSVYDDGELSEEATCKEYLQVQPEAGRAVERKLRFYNLD
jgi:hypothetical protein